jgi:hypothetical protein
MAVPVVKAEVFSKTNRSSVLATTVVSTLFSTKILILKLGSPSRCGRFSEPWGAWSPEGWDIAKAVQRAGGAHYKGLNSVDRRIPNRIFHV